MTDFSLYSTYIAGSSHIRDGRPVQDRADAFVLRLADGRQAAVLALADGHGSQAHFRSGIGAEFAIDAVRQSVASFIPDIEAVVPRGDFLVTCAAGNRAGAIGTVMNRLFSDICARWCDSVLTHWRNNPPLPQDPPSPVPSRPYGCTLLGAVRLDGIWFAFQLGDGAVVALDPAPARMDPVLPDPRCADNVTTSLCCNGPEDFRFCIGSEPPAALMLMSDGLERCYSTHCDIVGDFLVPVADEAAAVGFDAAMAQMREQLPILSAQGSHDDISLAMWMNPEKAAFAAMRIQPELVRRYSSELESLRAELEGLELSAVRIRTDCSGTDDPEVRASVLRSLSRRRGEILEEIEYLRTRLGI
ncbi:MAG: protein phosphatase 2C domain-containing protein [Muribaculaceae bacterium]|nr:protein phosphatase 2C domain-containing protein [Muribaculaceae bacterium]